MSRLEGDTHIGKQWKIREVPNEQPLALGFKELPWHADIVNYLVSEVFLLDATSQRRKILAHDAKLYLWDEPYLFK